MNNEIPKPVKQKKASPDRRNEYKHEWKRLFEEVYPGIVVHLENCSNLLDKQVGSSIRLDTSFSHPEILVILPPELGSYYLAGLQNDRMFSDVEVSMDEAYYGQDGDAFDCEPKTYTWEHFYYELCKNVELIKKRIPKPPTL